MASKQIDCVVADWGTSNRRAWALAWDGTVHAERHDDQGLLALTDRGFAASFQRFCGDWLAPGNVIPVVMAGMVGSKLGWQEVPYQMAPIELRDLSRHLTRIDDPSTPNCWVVPGVALDDGVKLDVMRGEECQILGALLQSDKEEGVFILPGTHAKWVQVRAGRIVGFRTYMTGEIFGLLRQSGTLSQLMGGDTADDEAFHKGVMQAQQPDAGNLLHSLFSVRTLGLFDRLPRSALASYMSGLLIGAEIRDAIGWLGPRSKSDNITAIGSPTLLHAYQLAATSLGVNLVCEDNAEVLPSALLFLAKAAGLSSGH